MAEMTWTPEFIQQLRDLWAAGHSTNEIARRLGLTKNQVIGKAHRLDMDARPSPIRRDASALPAIPSVRRRVFVLPPLASLATPAWNANPPPPPATHDLVVRMLTAGASNVNTAESASLSVAEVRKIRKTIEVPLREREAAAPRKRATDDTRVYGPDLAFKHRNGPPLGYTAYATGGFGERFQFGKQTERRKLAGKFPTAAEIEAHIAERGVTKCPTAAVAVTSASIAAKDRVVISEYRDARQTEWDAKNAPRNKRGTNASKRAAAMRR